MRRLDGDSLEPPRLLGVAVDVTAAREAERVHQAVLEMSNEALVGWSPPLSDLELQELLKMPSLRPGNAELAVPPVR